MTGPERMQVADVLGPLETGRVTALARELAIGTAGLGKDELIARIAGALGAGVASRQSPEAVRVLVNALTPEDCLAVVAAFDVTRSTGLQDAGDARAKVLLLCERPAPARRAGPPRGERPAVFGHAVFRHAFVPGILALSVVAWIFRTPSAQFLKSARAPFDFMSIALLASIALIGLAEQVYPNNAAWNYHLLTGSPHGWRQLGRDLLYLFAIARITVLLVAATTPILKRVSDRIGLHPLHANPGLPFALKVAVAFLVVELFSYALHRAAHRVPLLWRFHKTHHVITELTGLKALRTHPVDNLLFHLARSAPLLFVGADLDLILAVTWLGSVLGLLAHANIRVSEAGLGWLINFPSYHAVHHSADETESKSNFGCHTILWDRLFGTFRQVDRAGLTIGVRPVGPRSLWQELVEPLYRS